MRGQHSARRNGMRFAQKVANTGEPAGGVLLLELLMIRVQSRQSLAPLRQPLFVRRGGFLHGKPPKGYGASHILGESWWITGDVGDRCGVWVSVLKQMRQGHAGRPRCTNTKLGWLRRMDRDRHVPEARKGKHA